MDRTEQTRCDGVTETLWGCCDDATSRPQRVPGSGLRGRLRGRNPTADDVCTFQRAGSLDAAAARVFGGAKVTKYGCDLRDPSEWCNGVRGVAEPDAMTRSGYYYESEAKKLYLKLVSTGTDYEKLRVDPLAQ